jgi:Predicted membrane protein (DUF2243)
VTTEYQPTLSKPIRIEPVNLPAISRTIGLLRPSGGWRVHARPTKIPNVVEGLIDHQILGVHHVRDDLGGPLSWDIGFLIFGVLLIVGGWSLHLVGLHALQRRALTTR